MWKRTRLVLGFLALICAGCGEGADDEADAEMQTPLECGEMTCASGEYCRATTGGAAPVVNYQCVALPDGCDRCECLEESAFCQEVSGGLYVEIPLP